VGGLAQDQIPRPETGAEVRLGAEEEDDAHQRERRNKPEDGKLAPSARVSLAHRPVMVAG
jgi:hypothetical protein